MCNKTCLAVTVAVIAGAVFAVLQRTGQLNELHFHGIEKCTHVSGAPGMEDMTIYKNTAFISSDARIVGHEEDGAIYTLNVQDKNKVLKKLPIKWPEGWDTAFLPHGLGLHVKGDELTLMVVSHPHAKNEGDQIVIFKVDGSEAAGYSLTFKAAVHSEIFTVMNDVIPLTPTSFFVTQFLGYRDLRVVAEAVLSLPAGGVQYCEVVNSTYCKCEQKVTGIHMGNGVNVNADHTKLYVASNADLCVHVYSINQKTHDLTLDKKGCVPSHVDNIEVDPETGMLYTGTHPHQLSFVYHAAKRTYKSPTQVYRFDPSKTPMVGEELLLHDGSQLAGSSVAAPFRADPAHPEKVSFVVGGVFDDGVLVCHP